MLKMRERRLVGHWELEKLSGVENTLVLSRQLFIEGLK